MGKADRLLKRLDRLLAAEKARPGLRINLSSGKYMVCGAVPLALNGYFSANGTPQTESEWRADGDTQTQTG